MSALEVIKRHGALFILTLIVGALIVILGLNFVGSDKVERQLDHLYGVEDRQFQHEMSLFFGTPIVDGNQVDYLHNGDEIFPAMLEAVRGAKRFIAFETYIYWSEQIGREFADALAERGRAGVPVHVVIDAVGSNSMDENMLKSMQQAGVELHLYRPLRWYNLGRINNRTHRKLLIVDGQIGFTGGVGIADQWLGTAQDPEHWRDAHFRLRGPAVLQMQAVFNDNWLQATGKVLHGPTYFPATVNAGSARAQVFSSAANSGSDSMQLMYLMAISSATREIDISASYFVPDHLTRATMVAALRRGVRIRFILPGEHMDAELVRYASRAHWGPLLREGAEIYEYQPTMFHTKVMTVDGVMATVGSTNLDARSFRLNDEANLNIYDPSFAARMTSIFEEDIKRSHRVTYEMWLARSWKERMEERLAEPFSSQL